MTSGMSELCKLTRNMSAMTWSHSAYRHAGKSGNLYCLLGAVQATFIQDHLV